MSDYTLAHADMRRFRHEPPCYSCCPLCATDLGVSLEEIATLWEAKEAKRLEELAEYWAAEDAHYARYDEIVNAARGQIESHPIGFVEEGCESEGCESEHRGYPYLWYARSGSLLVNIFLRDNEWMGWVLRVGRCPESGVYDYEGTLEECLRRVSLTPENLINLAQEHWPEYLPEHWD